MLSNPNMTLAEFVEKISDFELQPHQRKMLEAFERGERLTVDMLPRRGRRVVPNPLRPLTDGRFKDTVTGEVLEPVLIRDDPYARY